MADNSSERGSLTNYNAGETARRKLGAAFWSEAAKLAPASEATPMDTPAGGSERVRSENSNNRGLRTRNLVQGRIRMEHSRKFSWRGLVRSNNHMISVSMVLII